jgi:hypothetical protein
MESDMHGAQLSLGIRALHDIDDRRTAMASRWMNGGSA